MLPLLVFVEVFLFTALALMLEWVDRKVYARVQHRVGPFVTGFKGILQPLADFLKLMGKEEVEVEGGDRLILNLSPPLSLALVLFALTFIPVVSCRGLLSLRGDLIILIAITAVLLAIAMATGYAQPNPFAYVGAARWAQLFISFEFPFLLSIASAVMVAGSITLADIIRWQAEHLPLAVFTPLTLVPLVLSVLAELEKAPFHIPDAETEIAGGWLVDVSGRRLALFRLTKDLELLLLLALFIDVYLGGPNGPIIAGLVTLSHGLWFLVKLLVLTVIISYIRGIVARYRIDQAIKVLWAWSVPLAAVNLAAILIYKILVGLP